MTQQDDDLQVSKSQLKREAHAAQALGERLVELNNGTLQQLPLDDELLQAIHLAQSLKNKHGALKRQLQFIGKLMRERNSDELATALDRLSRPQQNDIRRFHLVEQWRDRLATEGDAAVTLFVESYPDTDRQTLRQLVRNAQSSDTNQVTRARRKLFKFVDAIIPAGE